MPHLAAVVLLHAVAELAEVAVSPEPAVIVVNRRDESPCEQAHQHSIRACTPASPRPASPAVRELGMYGSVMLRYESFL